MKFSIPILIKNSFVVPMGDAENPSGYIRKKRPDFVGLFKIKD